MKFFGTMIMALTVTLAMGQYRQTQPGYEEYETDYESARPTHPTPRSYASSAPQQRPTEASAPKPTPVAILKQINRHNEDGSYTYGFEGADGSFKIETKQASGAVSGKYGYVDDSGKVRVVEYGADQYGFQPAGEGITVAPPTLVDENEGKDGSQNQNLDYQEYQQPARQQPQQRPIPQIVPALARPAYRQSQPPPPPQQQPQQPQYQNEAAPINRPIFSPASSQLQQSQIIRSQNEYERAPLSQTYNQGPVQFNPAPVQENPAPAQPVRAPVAQARAAAGGILDQLARDYALPQGGSAPLHDISFGYY